MNDDYRVRITRVAVVPVGEDLNSELCAVVAIEDEGAGEFLTIEQQCRCSAVKHQTITISERSEWEGIKAGVEMLLKGIDWAEGTDGRNGKDE